MSGGSFNNGQQNVRCAYRNRNNARNRNDNNGFRCFREVRSGQWPAAGIVGITVPGSVRPSYIRIPLPARALVRAEDCFRPLPTRSSRERASGGGGFSPRTGDSIDE